MVYNKKLYLRELKNYKAMFTSQKVEIIDIIILLLY